MHDVLGDVEQLWGAGLQGATVLANGDAEAVDHVDVHRVDPAAARLQAPQLHVVLAHILQRGGFAAKSAWLHAVSWETNGNLTGHSPLLQTLA